MKVKLRSIWASARGVFPANSIVEVSKDLGEALISTRQAELAEKDEPVFTPPEAASAQTPENAALPTGRGRKRA